MEVNKIYEFSNYEFVKDQEQNLFHMHWWTWFVKNQFPDLE